MSKDARIDTSGFETIAEVVKRTLDFDRISCPMAGCGRRGLFSDGSLALILSPENGLALQSSLMRRMWTFSFLLCVSYCRQHMGGRD